MAALVPLETYGSAASQHALLGLEGSGRGLRMLRAEWSR
jgi:hypothetical protein